MKKLKIGLFSLFALTVGGTAVISAVPQTAVAKPNPFSFIKRWLERLLDIVLDLLVDYAKQKIQSGQWKVAPSPGTSTGSHTVDVNLTTLIKAPEMIADFTQDGASLSTSQLYLGGDLVLQNNAEMVIVLKKGTYRIAPDGNAKLVLDIFKPSPTFPDPKGTFKF